MMTEPDSPRTPPQVPLPPPAKAANANVVDSKALFRDAHEVQILHRGAIYRLQCTRNGKLILVK